MSEPPNGCERPLIEPTTEAKKRKFSTAPATSALTEEIALPTLRTSSSASSLRFATIASASAWRSRDRSVGGVFPHGPASAARAASTALSISASPAIATRASAAPVAGSVRSRSSPDWGSTSSPLMKSPYSRSVATAIGAEDTGFAPLSAGHTRPMTDTAHVEAARIPDRDRLLRELRHAGLDARPLDEGGIEVRTDYDSLLAEVEGMITS